MGNYYSLKVKTKIKITIQNSSFIIRNTKNS